MFKLIFFFQCVTDGKNLIELKDDLKFACDEYRKRFSEVCHELYELGLKEEIRRRSEIKSLNDVIEDKLKAAIEKSRKWVFQPYGVLKVFYLYKNVEKSRLLESVEGKKIEVSVRVTQLLREASVAADEADLDDDAIDEIDKVASQLSWEFNDYVSGVWSKLMRDETILHEQIEVYFESDPVFFRPE